MGDVTKARSEDDGGERGVVTDRPDGVAASSDASPAADAPRPRPWTEILQTPRALRILRLLALAILGVLLVRTAWVGDDAYITLRTIDNFVNGHGLRWNVDERVQAFTHPLWLFLTTIPYFITHEAFYTVLCVSILVSLAAVAALLFRAGAKPAGLAVGILILLSSRAFVDYSTSGLENPLTHLLLLLFVLRLPEGVPGTRRATELALLAGLAAVNRMDSLLLFAPGLVFAFRHARRPKDLLPLIIGFAPFLLWEIFATIYYGFPYPNTAAAKLRSGIGGTTLLRHGIYYFQDSVRRDPVTLTGIVLGLALAAYRRRPRELAAAAGVLLYLLYVIRIGGDFMSGRFFSAPLLLAVVLLIRAEPMPHRLVRPALAIVVLLLGIVTPYPPIVSGRDFGLVKEGLIDRHGICDERRYYFGLSGMLNRHPTGEKPTNEATMIGRQLRRSGVPVTVEGAVGFTGYFAGPKVHVVDYHALGDPLLARMPMVAHDRLYDRALLGLDGYTDPEGWRIGHFLRNVPKGYLATLLTGENRIAEPNLARFYDHLRLIIRGPVWSGRRLADVVRMNTGGYDGLVDRKRPPVDTEIDWDEYIAANANFAEPYYRRGRDAIDRKANAQAIDDLREAVRRDPEHIDALTLLGKLLTDEGEIDPAIAIWNRVLRIDPRNAAAYVYLGDIALRTGEVERAIGFLEQAIKLDPGLAIAYNNLGVAYSFLGDYPRALTWLRRALGFRPNSADNLEDIGRVYLEMKEYGKAVATLEKALRIDPKRESAMVPVASAYENQGNAAKAIAMLRRAVEIEPQDAEALFELGRMLEKGQSSGEGRDAIRRAAAMGYEPAQQALEAGGGN
jgi:arabinofuranosyltransferase